MQEKLSALSRNRPIKTEPERPPATRRRVRDLLTRSIPLATGLGAVILLFLLFGERLLPAAEVEVETVVTASGERSAGISPATGSGIAPADPYSGSVLFQASGWFESDPYPYRATALANGVVENVHVLEGQPVKAGEPIVTMIREDAELRLRMASASLDAAAASLRAGESEFDLAHARVESMRREIAVAKARREELVDLAERAEELGSEVLAEQDIIQARLRLKTQEEMIAALQSQLREREIEAERLAGQLQVERGQLAEAEVRQREAMLELERMEVPAPVDGIIQRLMAAPGQKKVLMADNPESATIALLYQPGNIQARIDVPIAEASRLSPGQAVIIQTEYLPERELRGHIQRVVGEADLQRNTLQVKVRINDPPPELRPEILCRAQFLDTRITGFADSPEPSGPAREPVNLSGSLQVMVPQSALVDASGDSASVWAVDTGGRRLERRNVRLGREKREGYVSVLEGLQPGDRVVVRPDGDLKDGMRIQI